MSEIAILIVVYKRLNNLEKLITSLQDSNNEILVYVDFDDYHSAENKAVISCVKKFTSSRVVTSTINVKNVGPGFAVPEAIRWGFQYANYLLVIEDDCEIGTKALQYFRSTQHLINSRIKVISGRAAWNEGALARPKKILTLTNYALTNGWLVSYDAWNDLSLYLSKKISVIKIAKYLLLHPFNALPLLFFYSACLINSKTERKAWDCYIILQMILENYYAINPDLTCISTGGIDEIATNTKINKLEQSTYIALASEKSPSSVLNCDQNFINSNNRHIEKNLYRIKTYHLLSPLKAWLRTFKYNSI